MAALRLDDRYRAETGSVYLTGVQALVRLPLDVRRTDRRRGLHTAGFISGYEGSPLGGYDLELLRQETLLTEHEVVFRPGLNEELAATAVQGSQLAPDTAGSRFAGVTGYWYGKSPGLDRAADALRHSNLMGTHHLGGAVAFVGDDPAAKSSTVPGASEALLADLGIPTLYPADAADVLRLGLHAVALSRASGLWAALKVVTNVADGAGTVDLDATLPDVPTVHEESGGEPYRHRVNAKMLQPVSGELERSRSGPRLEIARRYAAANPLNEIVRSAADDRVGLVAAGKTFRDLRHALDLIGLDDHALADAGVRLLRIGMIYPLETGIVTRFAAGLREIIVVEEKRAFLETAFKDVLYAVPERPVISGKSGPDGQTLFPADGELDADSLCRPLATRLAAIGGFPAARRWLDTHPVQRERITLPLVARTPYFCSGCPHNSSTKTPAGSLVGAGIGCHTMTLLMAPEQVGTMTGLTQMGGEGAQWIGMSPFVDAPHLIQNLGDGTFHHSGSLAIRAAVAAGVNVTYKLLYNSAVAMTGGQQPMGQMSVPAITQMLMAEGVARVIVTTEDPARYRGRLPRAVQAWDRDRLLEAQEVLAEVPGVTVLIHDQECATELRRKRKRGLATERSTRVAINPRVCEGCGDCGRKSNCLSVQPVETPFGRKTRIDQSSCNVDYSCLDGDCPSFLTVRSGRGGRSRTPVPLGDQDLPEVAVSGVATHVTRIAGVGGSGVVTLAQILGTAATISGRHVQVLDQTGLAQKGGAVVSDVTISATATVRSNKASSESVDLYLGSDLLVSAQEANLRVAAAARTLAVVSTTAVPTGPMVVDPALSFPHIPDVVDRIRGRARAGSTFVDAVGVTTTLFGDGQFANMLLLGIAYQSGAVPVPSAAIEAAIELNGVKTAENVQAFRRGRQYVADRAAFDACVQDPSVDSAARAAPPAAAAELVAIVDAVPSGRLSHVLQQRVGDLIAYQDRAYARRYVQLVERVRVTEARQVGGGEELATEVARQLYKLMAYKDEYEVARLSLDPAARRAALAEFGPDAQVSYRLHPPLLRSLGLKRKITLGPWFDPVFRALIVLRRLRGTPFDPFGYAKVRRVERDLIEEYRGVVEDLLPTLSPANHSAAIEVASLPDMIRGYEQIKLDSVAAYRQRLPGTAAATETTSQPAGAK